VVERSIKTILVGSVEYFVISLVGDKGKSLRNMERKKK
jgi:hypothetical protein